MNPIPEQIIEKRILRTPEAAEYIGLTASTLEKMRLHGDGPGFIRLTKKAVGYDIKTLDNWIDSRKKLRSTSE